MALDPAALPQDYVNFLAERHLATLTTVRPDGSPHVVPVGFAFDDKDPRGPIVRVITNRASKKARNVAAHGYAVVCQVDGARWATLEGPAEVRDDSPTVAAGVAAYTARYQAPRDNPDRVVIEITLARAMGRG